MPEVARFFGIIIRMYPEAGGAHSRPHLHAYYQEEVAVYAIDSIELLAGALPKQQQSRVEAWVEVHQKELLANWESLLQGRAPAKIEPVE